MQSDRIDSLAVNFWRTTLKIFNAADFGIVPNEDISEKLAEFISALKAEDGEKTAVFDSGTYHITVDPKLFMPAVTPYLAACYALALNLGYGFFCGSLLFLINLSGGRVLGFAVLSAQHIISYLIRFKYLPFFISVFSNHGFSEDAGLPSVGFSCAYFCLFAAIIVACILRAVRHVDLKITVGTRI